MIRKNTRKSQIKMGTQLSFDFEIPKKEDRNFHLGGRSFYFFDFDDNVAYLSTPIILFNKKTGEEITLSSGEFAENHRDIGKSGKYENYFMEFNDESGSFRHFRDKKFTANQVRSGIKQTFIEDIEKALENADHAWKAPSWNSFYHATYNQRPVSLITARGHHPETIKAGIDLMVKDGHLPIAPNYHSIYPVSNVDIRKELGDLTLTKTVPELKKDAIRFSVEKALGDYGTSPFHRFGMSDDDPKNIELITEEMRDLKFKYPDMSFFVIQTFKDSYTKFEVLPYETREIVSQKQSRSNQLTLF
ncbi:MAG: hypothetical protein L6Q33_13225 [Bacteriovoracaceae bacterium]|jgi:hypothetical protein|nr:hypothetical protein [Bacteriovoracaceae bacterium]